MLHVHEYLIHSPRVCVLAAFFLHSGVPFHIYSTMKHKEKGGKGEKGKNKKNLGGTKNVGLLFECVFVHTFRGEITFTCVCESKNMIKPPARHLRTDKKKLFFVYVNKYFFYDVEKEKYFFWCIYFLYNHMCVWCVAQLVFYAA